MANLTLKKVNAAIAAEGINLVVYKEKTGPWPLYYECPFPLGKWTRNCLITKINDATLGEWLDHARFWAQQTNMISSRIMLPEWIKIGSSVVVVDNRHAEWKTVIDMVTTDGITIFVSYENANIPSTELSVTGDHQHGTVLFRDHSSLQSAKDRSKNMYKLISAFSGMSTDEQNALLQTLLK